MSKIKFTSEQKKIFTFIKKRDENLLIAARAGCGKTFVIVNATKLIPKDKDIIFLAFNKHIQEELIHKLPDYVRCYTSHGIGLAAIKRAYKNIEFDEFKVDHIIKKKAVRWNLNNEYPDPHDRFIYLNTIKKAVNLCRTTLTMDKKWIRNLLEMYDIKYDSDNDVRRIASVMETMINDRNTFDFTDMVFLPAIDNKIWLFPQDYVFVDEAQDLSKAQQKMIEKMLKRDKVSKKIKGRLIAVGDNFQSIYSFAGSSNKSFEWFSKFPNTKVLPLTHTFRCAKDIVKKANEIVPDIKALDGAPEGQVRDGDVLAEAEEGDFVLCRITEPLIKLFFKFLLENKRVMIKGSDIGMSLIEMTKDMKSVNQLVSFWQNKLENLSAELKKRGVLDYRQDSGFQNLEDKVNTICFLAQLSEDIPDLRDKISKIFRDDENGGIVLSTVHKSKGLEADRVFIIRPDKLPLPTPIAWQYLQEKNLYYVAITRARHELIFDREFDMEEKL